MAGVATVGVADMPATVEVATKAETGATGCDVVFVFAIKAPVGGNEVVAEGDPRKLLWAAVEA